MDTEHSKSLQELQELAQRHFKSLKPHAYKKGAYTIPIRVAGYADLLYLISDLIKVSMAGIEENEEGYNPDLTVNPRANIRNILEIVVQLLPHQEAEYLDLLQEAFFETEAEKQ